VAGEPGERVQIGGFVFGDGATETSTE